MVSATGKDQADLGGGDDAVGHAEDGGVGGSAGNG